MRVVSGVECIVARDEKGLNGFFYRSLRRSAVRMDTLPLTDNRDFIFFFCSGHNVLLQRVGTRLVTKLLTCFVVEPVSFAIGVSLNPIIASFSVDIVVRSFWQPFTPAIKTLQPGFQKSVDRLPRSATVPIEFSSEDTQCQEFLPKIPVFFFNFQMGLQPVPKSKPTVPP